MRWLALPGVAVVALVAPVAPMVIAGCGSGGRPGGGFTDGSVEARDLRSGGGPVDLAIGRADASQVGCGEVSGCYTVYAHGDHVLYRIDLPNKLLVEAGGVNAPM